MPLPLANEREAVADYFKSLGDIFGLRGGGRQAQYDALSRIGNAWEQQNSEWEASNPSVLMDFLRESLPIYDAGTNMGDMNKHIREGKYGEAGVDGALLISNMIPFGKPTARVGVSLIKKAADPLGRFIQMYGPAFKSLAGNQALGGAAGTVWNQIDDNLLSQYEKIQNQQEYVNSVKEQALQQFLINSNRA